MTTVVACAKGFEIKGPLENGFEIGKFWDVALLNGMTGLTFGLLTPEVKGFAGAAPYGFVIGGTPKGFGTAASLETVDDDDKAFAANGLGGAADDGI